MKTESVVLVAALLTGGMSLSLQPTMAAASTAVDCGSVDCSDADWQLCIAIEDPPGCDDNPQAVYTACQNALVTQIGGDLAECCEADPDHSTVECDATGAPHNCTYPNETWLHCEYRDETCYPFCE